MSELKKMLERDFGGAHVVQNDVGHTFHLVVSRHRDHGHRERKSPGSIDRDQAIDRALQEEPRIFVDQVGAVAVAYDKVEVPFLQEMVFHTAHDRGGIAVADFRDDDADGEAALGAQGAGKKVGTVFVLPGGGKNAVFRFLRDGVRHGRAIDDEGYGSGGKSEAFRQFFQAHRFGPHAHGPRSALCPLFFVVTLRSLAQTESG